MMHYAATPESDAELKPEGFLLVDSGGHYFDGNDRHHRREQSTTDAAPT